MDNEANQKKKPVHFTQAFDLKVKEKDLDFFDVNLQFDSRIFIDPFLIRKSSIEDERILFDRFGDYFRYAYDVSLGIDSDIEEYNRLKNLLNIHEPSEIGLGYTEHSHDGAGPGPSFAKQLFDFFVNSSAKRLIKEEGLYPDGKFNPVTLEIFADRLGPDGISDITANLIMDYLIKYTQDQCEIFDIETTTLPVKYDGFNFNEMEWEGGGYYDLPENPLKEGTPVILVPKRFLRAPELYSDTIESKVKGILNHDPELSRKFSLFVNKKISELGIEDVRAVFLKDESVFAKYLEILSRERKEPYDFEEDLLRILSIKSYSNFFEDKTKPGSINSCESLLKQTLSFVDIVSDHFSRADGWRDVWREKGGKFLPHKEAVFGRIFRGMGYAYFSHLPTVTFEPEVDMGDGPVDFKIIYKDCRIVIEIKKLSNASRVGDPPTPAYLHGVKEQLPDYAYLSRADYAIYITGQHYNSRNRPKNNHDDRSEEIEGLLNEVTAKMRSKRSNFKDLHYINIDFAPHPSASKK